MLREARENAGLSLGEVAVRSGLNRQAVAFIEQGERNPTADTYVRIALALGLRPSELWARVEATFPEGWWKKVA